MFTNQAVIGKYNFKQFTLDGKHRLTGYVLPHQLN